jgi:hypothetical protein
LQSIHDQVAQGDAAPGRQNLGAAEKRVGQFDGGFRTAVDMGLRLDVHSTSSAAGF